jgi:hypothetical protein
MSAEWHSCRMWIGWLELDHLLSAHRQLRRSDD